MRNYSCRYSPGFTPGSLLLQLHDFEIAIPKSECKGINIFYIGAYKFAFTSNIILSISMRIYYF